MTGTFQHWNNNVRKLQNTVMIGNSHGPWNQKCKCLGRVSLKKNEGIICAVGRSLAMWGSVNLGRWGAPGMIDLVVGSQGVNG